MTTVDARVLPQPVLAYSNPAAFDVGTKGAWYALHAHACARLAWAWGRGGKASQYAIYLYATYALLRTDMLNQTEHAVSLLYITDRASPSFAWSPRASGGAV